MGRAHLTAALFMRGRSRIHLLGKREFSIQNAA